MENKVSDRTSVMLFDIVNDKTLVMVKRVNINLLAAERFQEPEFGQH